MHGWGSTPYVSSIWAFCRKFRSDVSGVCPLQERGGGKRRSKHLSVHREHKKCITCVKPTERVADKLGFPPDTTPTCCRAEKRADPGKKTKKHHTFNLQLCQTNYCCSKCSIQFKFLATSGQQSLMLFISLRLRTWGAGFTDAVLPPLSSHTGQEAGGIFVLLSLLSIHFFTA